MSFLDRFELDRLFSRLFSILFSGTDSFDESKEPPGSFRFYIPAVVWFLLADAGVLKRIGTKIEESIPILSPEWGGGILHNISLILFCILTFWLLVALANLVWYLTCMIWELDRQREYVDRTIAGAHAGAFGLLAYQQGSDFLLWFLALLGVIYGFSPRESK